MQLVEVAVIAAVQYTELDGASGEVAFDGYGDTVLKVLTMYRIENGVWDPVKTGEFEG